MGSWRDRLTAALAVLAAVAACAAAVVGYVRHAVLDSTQFANRSTAALDDPAVRDFLGAKIAEGLVAQSPDLVAVQPILRSAGAAVVGGSAFRGIYRSAVRDVHRAVVDGDQDTVLLTLTDIGVVVRDTLARASPAVAAKVEPDAAAQVLQERISSRLARAIHRLHDLRALTWLLALAALALGGLALALARDRRRAVVWLGGGLAVTAVAAIVATGLARGAVLGQIGDPQARAAAGGLWTAVLGDLRTVLLLVAIAGALTAAAAASLLRPVSLDEPLRRAWDVVTTRPPGSGARAVRAVLLLAAGLAAIADPGAMVELVGLGVGVLLVIGGASEVVRLIERPLADAERQARAAAERGEQPRRLVRVARRLPLRAIVAGALVVLLLGFAGGLVARDGGITAPPPPVERCNGHAALCDKRLDEVALAGTHNSMSSAADPGWLFAQQDRGIADQLRDGIRALLIDTYYGTPVGDRVRTDIEIGGDTRAKLEQEIGPEAVDAALRIRDRLVGGKEGKPGIFLCHGLCELGATPLKDALADVSRFLAGHPHDVVVLVVQDTVKPADFIAAVRAAGLEHKAYAGRIAPPWPTLRRLIEDDQRLIVLAEERGEDAPWLHPAFAAIQETPFRFTRAAQLTDPELLSASCAKNRGEPGATLFQLNHWIDTSPAPRPSNAEKVNTRDAILARARACRERRGLMPNVVAVDFYRRGDVFGAVDELNGVAAAQR